MSVSYIANQVLGLSLKSTTSMSRSVHSNDALLHYSSAGADVHKIILLRSSETNTAAHDRRGCTGEMQRRSAALHQHIAC
jgi:hypothetical protein